MTTILAIDDDTMNLEIIRENLADTGYHLVLATSSAEAWALLKDHPDRFDAVLLDCMMPEMDGLAVLALMKHEPATLSVPVIMQTAAASPHEVHAGLSAGAYYYLTKPYTKEMLQVILRAAVADYTLYRRMRQETQRITQAFALLETGRFRFRTHNEAKYLSTLIASACPNPETAVIGIYELLLNAVEHGNLGITYKDKSRLLKANCWDEEIARRLAMTEYASRVATVAFERKPAGILLTVTDQGTGFDWRPYLEFSPSRAFDPHGRGIAIAHKLSFTHLEYRGIGNEVAAFVDIPAHTATPPYPAQSTRFDPES